MFLNIHSVLVNLLFIGAIHNNITVRGPLYLNIKLYYHTFIVYTNKYSSIVKQAMLAYVNHTRTISRIQPVLSN